MEFIPFILVQKNQNEHAYKEETFFGSRVERDLKRFKEECELIISNRKSDELTDVEEKVYTRDLFSVD